MGSPYLPVSEPLRALQRQGMPPALSCTELALFVSCALQDPSRRPEPGPGASWSPCLRVLSTVLMSKPPDIWGPQSHPPTILTPQAVHFHTNQLVQINARIQPTPTRQATVGDTAQDPASSKPSGHRDTSLLAGGDVSYCFLSAPQTVRWDCLGAGHVVGAYKMPADSIVCWVPL